MGVSRFFMAVAVLGALLASAGSHAVAQEQCVLGTDYPVRSVSAHRVMYGPDGSYYDRVNPVLRGAEVRIAAEPGLTQEWLERRVEAQLMAGICELGARQVEVDVLSMGDEFAVRLTSSDQGAANEILRQARDELMR
jgi:hypothetical protein